MWSSEVSSKNLLLSFASGSSLVPVTVLLWIPSLTRPFPLYENNKLARPPPPPPQSQFLSIWYGFLEKMKLDATVVEPNHLFEFYRIEFCRIYRIYRICRKLFLVILKMKFSKNSLLHIL